MRYGAMKTFLLVPSLFLILTAFLHAELRDFTGSNGKVIKASLVSHKAGKVTLRREDGKEFTVEPNVFGPDDQVYIQKWMKKTPQTVDYNFRIEAKKEKASGNRSNLGYKTVKNEKWAYRVKISNLSRDTVSGLTVKYKIFYSNRADGEFSAGSYDLKDLAVVRGEAKLSSELAYNHTMEFATKQVQIDVVDYDGYKSRYKDELKGCMLRIVDPKGNVVADWKHSTSHLTSLTWDSTEPQGKNQSSTVIVR